MSSHPDFPKIATKTIQFAALLALLCGALVLIFTLVVMLADLVAVANAFAWLGKSTIAMCSAALFGGLTIVVIVVGWKQYSLSWSFSGNIALTLIACMLLLLLMGFATHRTQYWLEHSNNKIVATEKLKQPLEHIADEISKIHIFDYLLTGDEKFVSRYALIQANINTELNILTEINSSPVTEQHQVHINQIIAMTRRQLQWYQQAIDTKRIGMSAVDRDKMIRQGTNLLNKWHSLLAHFDTAHYQMYTEVQQQTHAVFRLSYLIIFVGTFSSVIVFLFTLLRLNLVEAEYKKNQQALSLQAQRAEALLELPKVAEQLTETAFMQHGQELTENLTDSQIAFIHFINDDEENIELVTWSRRTLELYCHAVCDKHYPVSHAGIWADALRQRQPVICNDYAAHPRKNGLPDGHSPLQRLISVPVIDNDKVVMLAGVGNKATDYTDFDVETVQLIANEIWHIVQQRRTQIKAARFGRVLEHSLNEIYIFDSQSLRFVDVNLGARTNLGYTLQELQHMTLLNIQSDFTSESFQTLVADLQSGVQKKLIFDTQHKRKNRTTYPVEIHLELTDEQPSLFVAIVLDITERKRSEKSILAREALFQAISQSANDAIITANHWGKIVKWNKAAENIFGYTETEIIGQSLTRLMPQRFRNAHLAAMQRLYVAGKPRIMGKPVELAGLRKDQTEFPLEISLAQWQIEAQHFYTGVIRDITKRKQRELELANSNKRFSALIEAIPDALFFKDGAGRWLLTNEAAKCLFRLHDIPWQGKTEMELAKLHPEFRAIHETCFIDDEKTWQNRHQTLFAETVIDQNGHSHDFEVRKVPVFDEQGQRQALVVIGRDITERKRMEAQLRKLAQAVEQSPVSIVITNLNAQIEYVNETFIKVTGYSREEVIGQNPHILSTGKIALETYLAMWERLTQGQSWKGEFINKRKDGSEYIELAIIAPLRQPDGQISHYVGVKEDITEKKCLAEELTRYRHHLEELVEQRTNELAQAKSQAEAANRAKSEFLANMSHEIRTPMNAILGFSAILAELISDPMQSHYLNAIQASGKTLLQLINDILDLSKIEAGKLELDYHWIEIKSILDDIHLIFAQKLAEKCIKFNLEIAKNTPHYLLLDEIRLRQILLNIVGNAVKFTEQGHIQASVQIEPTASAQHINLSIVIADTGIGIAKDQQQAIFSAFTQQKMQNQIYGGTGLGLTICKRLIEMMGGKISVSSESGQGSCFTITLPNVEFCYQSDTLFERKNQPLVKRVHFQPATLLIVDDIEFNRRLIKTILQAYPELTLMEAESGEQALDLIQKQPFDLIFMDKRLPGEDGDSICQKIKTMPGSANIPIIMITASVLTVTEAQHNTVYYDVRLGKPINKTELLATMQRFLPLDENSQIMEQTPPVTAEEPISRQVIEPEKLSELLDLLASRYQTTIMHLNSSSGLHINAIINVADELLQIAGQYQCGLLYEWATTLKNQAKLFDLTNLPKTLAGFSHLLEQLEKQ